MKFIILKMKKNFWQISNVLLEDKIKNIQIKTDQITYQKNKIDFLLLEKQKLTLIKSINFYQKMFFIYKMR